MLLPTQISMFTFDIYIPFLIGVFIRFFWSPAYESLPEVGGVKLYS
jgi:hypothetical protein